MKSHGPQKIQNIYVLIGFFFLFLSLIAIAIPIGPYVWYRINPHETDKDIEKIVKDITTEKIEHKTKTTSQVPPLDPSLPETPFVIIPKINIAAKYFFQLPTPSSFSWKTTGTLFPPSSFLSNLSDLSDLVLNNSKINHPKITMLPTENKLTIVELKTCSKLLESHI